MKNSWYTEIITEILEEQGNPDVDPRHIEGYMRLQYSTLDHLARFQFEKEVDLCTQCIRHGGLEMAESNAQSFGL